MSENIDWVSDEIERLRAEIGTHVWETNEKIESLSDEVERLRAENERLRDKLTFETEFGVNTFEKMNVNRIEIERLQARETRLREALQNIVYADGDYNLLQAKARAALGEEEK